LTCEQRIFLQKILCSTKHTPQTLKPLTNYLSKKTRNGSRASPGGCRVEPCEKNLQCPLEKTVILREKKKFSANEKKVPFL